MIKHMPSCRFAAMIVLLAAIPLSGCSTETRGSSAAPIISDLRVAPDTMSVGAQNAVSANLHFEDADANVLEAILDIGGGGAADTGEQSVPVTGTAGLTAGDVAVQLLLQPPTAGTYTLAIRLRDADGNDSNTLRAELAAR